MAAHDRLRAELDALPAARHDPDADLLLRRTADAVTAAAQDRARAVERERVANEVAARRIDALTEQLRDMTALPPSVAGSGAGGTWWQNFEGHEAGGPAQDLPVDPAALLAMLDAARRAGEPPSSYAPLLRQYYVVRAAQRAGIDLDDWDPAAGAQHNRDTIERVYRYYAKLFLMDDRLEWAGMANLVGPSFAAGFLDLHMVRELAAELDERVGDLPGPVQERLPPEVLGLAALSDLGEDELAFYERTLLAMQKEIFFDAGTMHEAYLERGLEGIEELRDAQIVDGQAVGAWQRIDRGAPEDVATATELLADREQNLTIADEYDDMRARFPTGPAMTYLMTVVGDPSIPGTKTPGEFSQLEVTGPWVRLVPVPPVGPGVEGRVVVTTSLPDFNIADRANRWRMITDDTLPAYRRLVDEQPESLRALVGADVGLLIEDNRLRQRWPRLVEDLRRGWALDPDVRGVAW